MYNMPARTFDRDGETIKSVWKTKIDSPSSEDPAEEVKKQVEEMWTRRENFDVTFMFGIVQSKATSVSCQSLVPSWG